MSKSYGETELGPLSISALRTKTVETEPLPVANGQVEVLYCHKNSQIIPVVTGKAQPEVRIDKRHHCKDTFRSSTQGLWILTGLLCLLWSCSSPRGQIRDDPVRFRYVDEDAKKVCVAGSFNQWSPSSHCMRRSKSTWTLQLLLPRGRYPYLFVIDDYVWKQDPGAILWEESGFGTKNSVLIVE